MPRCDVAATTTMYASVSLLWVQFSVFGRARLLMSHTWRRKSVREREKESVDVHSFLIEMQNGRGT